jgi:hypothetical protein
LPCGDQAGQLRTQGRNAESDTLRVQKLNRTAVSAFKY